MEVPSIYIPRVHPSVTWQDMKTVFDTLFGEGAVKRVDLRGGNRHDDPPPFRRAEVTMQHWPREHHEARDKLLRGESLKVYPNENNEHYWLCVLYKPREGAKGAPKLVV